MVATGGFEQSSPMSETLGRTTWSQLEELTPFLQSAAHEQRSMVVEQLKTQGADALALAVQTAKLVRKEDGRYIVEFSKEAAQKIGAKTATLSSDGAAQLVVRGGKYGEKAKIVGKASRSLTKVGTGLLAAAHIVSGADLAKKLSEANKKIDLLVALRKLDQMACLEAIYLQAKELAALPSCPGTQMELHRLGQDLHRLKATWRNEILLRLEETDTRSLEDGNLFQNLWREKQRKGNENKVATGLTSVQAELHAHRMAQALHLAIAQASGRAEVYLTQSCPEEEARLQGLLSLFEEKASPVMKKNSNKEAKERLNGFHLALWQTREFAASLAIKPTGNSAVIEEPNKKPNSPSATYKSTRLTFKRAVIEKLSPRQKFQVETPEGTFEFTRAQFRIQFPNVVASKSYQEKGSTTIPKPLRKR